MTSSLPMAELVSALRAKGLLRDGRFAPAVVSRFCRALNLDKTSLTTDLMQKLADAISKVCGQSALTEGGEDYASTRRSRASRVLIPPAVCPQTCSLISLACRPRV